MIYIITGKTGHGKSAYMTKWARDLLLRGHRIYSNVKMYPENMKLYKKHWWEWWKLKEKIYEGDITLPEHRNHNQCKILYWSNFSDWQFMESGTCFVDEGLVYFNARKWESLPDSMQQKFVQHRKDKIDLVFNIQHYTFIEKTLRILCERFINVELKIGSTKFKKSWIPRIARITDIELPTLNRCENLGIDPYAPKKEDAEKYHIENLGKEWFWIWNNKIINIFSWYDTSIKVLPSRPEPLIHTERTCNTCGHTKTIHN